MYEKIMAGLNAQQRKAVETIEGPLLVLAGPGTGKTQLLSARAANILIKTDSKPHNILALTYTEKAAQNMKQRMLEIIGSEARNIMVKTFHGLGVELINSYPEYFWNAARLQPAPEAIELEIIESVLNKRPLDDPYALKFMGEFTMADSARRHISQAKKAGLTPAKLRAISQLNIAQLEDLQQNWQELLSARMSKKLLPEYTKFLEKVPQVEVKDIAPTQPISRVLVDSLQRAISTSQELDKTKPLSEWKSEWTESQDGVRVFKDVERSQRMLALAEVYEQFQEQMLANGYFDFDDMILEVITQLKDRPDFRAAVQERFTHIMLDEFQDTNDAQFRLSYLIASNPDLDNRPNIMAVGDDDQAIYRFQGAELSNIDNFTKSFDGVTEIVLTKNYRSHQTVIDTAACTAELIEHRLIDIRSGLEKSLTQASDVEQGSIEHCIYSTEAEQLTEVARLADQAFKDDKSVAILSRSHKPLEHLASILHNQNTPIRYVKKSDILRLPVIEIYTAITRCLVGQQVYDQATVSMQIATILGHPMFAINPAELWEFGVRVRKNHLYDWLEAACQSDYPKISSVANWLRSLSTIANEEPAAVISEYILGLRELEGFISPLKNYYLNQDDSSYLETLSAIHKLRSLVAEFKATHQPRIADILRFIEINQDHGVHIADESAFVSSERAVELLSVHAAKGLEFDQIFIIDAVDNTWRPGPARFRPPANMEAMRPHGDSADDYARLMFVALTRAKNSITISSYQYNEHGKEVLATPLVANIKSTKQKNSEVNKLIVAAENFLRWPEPPKLDQKHLLAPLLETYQLPVTHLLNFIDVSDGGPQTFIERNLLRLPTVKTAHMAYGTAIHAALETGQQDTNRNRFTLEAVLARFEEALVQEQLPVHDEKRYLQKGLKLLDKLIVGEKLEFKPGVITERSVGNVRLNGGAILQGKLDAIEITENQITIIDYKTGKGLNTLDTFSKSEGLKALKHQLQLSFYALLAERSQIAKPKQTIVGKMVYIEAENDKYFSVEHCPNDQEIENLERLINSVWHKISIQDWPDITPYEQSRSGVEQFIEDLVNEKV